MATANVSAPQITTDPLYQTLLNDIHNAMVALGLVHVSQTGEWASSGTTRDNVEKFRVYRFDDALQSGSPVFIRIGCLGNTTSGGRFEINMNAGTSVNGSGVLGAQSNSTISNMNWTTALQIYFAGGVNYLAVSCFNNPVTTVTGWFGVERERDDAGNIIGGGVYHYYNTPVFSQQFVQYIPHIGARGPQEQPWTWYSGSAPSNGSDGTDNWGSPVCVRRGPLKPHGICFAAVIANDFPAVGSPVTTPMRGANRNYRRANTLVSFGTIAILVLNE